MSNKNEKGRKSDGELEFRPKIIDLDVKAIIKARDYKMVNISLPWKWVISFSNQTYIYF